jgi:hypothetical protein
LFDGLGNRIEHGYPALEQLPAFSWRHARDDLAPVSEAQLRMPGAEAPGDSLNQDPRMGSDENGHVWDLVADGRHNLLRRIGHGIAPGDSQTGFGQCLVPGLDVVSFQPHDQR